MDYGINSVFLENAVECGAVKDIRMVKPNGFTRDLLHTVERCGFAVGEVVDHRDFISSGEQFDAGVASDKACAACNQDHHIGSFR